MAGQKGYLALQIGFQRVQAFFRTGTKIRAGITDRRIKIGQHSQQLHILGIVTVYLVEHQFYRDTVSLGGRQKTVDKDSGGNRIVDSHDQHGLVHIGGNDM